ncbi:uncharacterized protein LOC130723348 [Lotus japonicus]|uniref:uncharacterized protein LOC130723348 n=1 Tax=Lotus japonicus TaxID=34305 RepID=UPI002587D4D4|nr:uncharacterized protein LOC130723348 [Lotus japonicus]
MAFLKMVLMVMVLFCALVSTDYVGTAQRMEKAQETNTAVNKINTEGIANALGISTTQMISPGPTSASDQMCNYIGPCIAEVHDEKCNQYCIFRGYLKGYCQASSAVPPYPLLCCCIKK